MELCFTAFMYLEWYRVQQMSRRDLSDEEKHAVAAPADIRSMPSSPFGEQQNESKYIADCLETPGGIRKLNRLVRNSFPSGSRAAA